MAYLAKSPPSRQPTPIARNAVALAGGRPVLPWPDELLASFSLRMSTHGMSISRIDMQCDARYALQQMHDARGMGDPTLALMADELLRCFDAQQAGRSGPSH